MKPYPPQTIDFICLHYQQDMSALEVAAEIGATPHNLRATVVRLRKAGFVIAHDTVKDGITRKRFNKNGSTFREVKIEGKWRYVPGSFVGVRQSKVKAAKKVRVGLCATPKKIEPSTHLELTQPHFKPNYHTPPRRTNPNSSGRAGQFATDRNPDCVNVKGQEGGAWVRLDSRTIVYRQARV